MEENQVCGRNQEFSVESEMFLKHLSQNAKYTVRHTSRARTVLVQLMRYTKALSGISPEVALFKNSTQ